MTAADGKDAAAVYEPTLTQPPRRRGRTALIVVAVITGACCIAGTTTALVGGALRGGGSPTPTSRPASTDDPVRDGQFEFVVRSVACGRSSIDNGWLHAEAKGQFCVADLTVTNIGLEERRFSDGLQRAYGPNGERYAADTGAGVVANGNGEAVWDVINPGISISTKVVYDIPAGGSIVQLELHDSALSGGVRVDLAS